MKLLNPGPVTVTTGVRQSVLQDDLCHREVECEQLIGDIRHKLEHVYSSQGDAYRAILLTGSGTLAVESMLASCVGKEDHVLLIANGIYGYRMGDILQRHHKSYQQLDFGLTGEIDYDEVRNTLSQGEFTHAACVHHETTIGRLNDLTLLSELCNQFNIKLLLDAVSSFGGEAIDFADPNLLAIAATANKCLHGYPGIAFVITREAAIANFENNCNSLYLDLFVHYEKQQHNKVAFTPAVQILYALQVALDELEQQGGWRARNIQYFALSSALRQGFKQAGIELAIPVAQCASMLSAFKLPQGVDFNQLHQRYKDQGYIIYPGQLNLGATIFRIATMGELTLNDMETIASIGTMICT